MNHSRTPRVLAVDEEAIMRTLIRRAAIEQQWDCDVAVNGQEAVQKVRANA